MNRAEEGAGGRGAEIVALVEKTGFASVTELAQRFAVTTQTIRRDVNALCEAGRLARFHGGVGLPSSTQNEAYDVRKTALTGAKAAIGRRAAAEVPDGASLFLGIGTTTEAVARALLRHERLRVVTNNLHVVEIMKEAPGAEIFLAGGEVRARDGGVVGEAAARFLEGFRPDLGITGTSGIAPDGTLLDFDAREVLATRAILHNARRTILVADRSKLGRPAMTKAGHLSEVDLWVTDGPLPEDYAAAAAAAGAAVVG